MSCCNNTNFADLKQTWTGQSSLNIGNYDPLPELSSSVLRYGPNTNSGCNLSKENYNSEYDAGNRGAFKDNQRIPPPFPNALNYSVITSFRPANNPRATWANGLNSPQLKNCIVASAKASAKASASRENYIQCCNENPYENLGHTWNHQLKYNL